MELLVIGTGVPCGLAMILHIPHSSNIIPEQFRQQVVLNDNDLNNELVLMTDKFTDELFALPGTSSVLFPISRLLVDVERFPDDEDEPMCKAGMGMIYSLTAYGKKLKRSLAPHEKMYLVSHYYETHHQKLLAEVKDELEKTEKALIVDCHSFPSQPLPCDLNQSIPRPDFCIGTDMFHTPDALIKETELNLQKMGYRVGINEPYGGTMVPMAFYRKDRRVASIMLEINRSLYMDETSITKTSDFDQITKQIHTLLYSIKEFQQTWPAK